MDRPSKSSLPTPTHCSRSSPLRGAPSGSSLCFCSAAFSPAAAVAVAVVGGDVRGERMGEQVLPIGDKLVLRGLRFHGFHGVHPEENKLGQKFVVDVDAWLDLRKAGQTDNLVDTISYTEIYRLVKGIVEGPPQNLLESVAHRIASSTLSKYPQVSAVRVEVKKPNVAVHDTIDYLGVEILRYQSHEK